MEAFFDKSKLIFKEIGWIDAVDIFLVCAVVYAILILFKKYNALGVMKYFGAALLLAFAVIVFRDELPVAFTMTIVFGSSLLTVVFVLFHSEFKRVIWKISGSKESGSFNNKYDCSDEELRAAMLDIVKALQNMSKRNVGALLVFPHNEMPSQVIESGVKLNSLLSDELIESIFITKGPLHDGAVIISGNKILAAGCFLPLSQNLSLPKDLGTRHRAAIGASESFNVTSIMVSEETGIISVAQHGQLSRYYDSLMLSEVLEQTFGLKAVAGKKKRR